jgi:radical SAM superfamily enzyme YgiQ (UPF0313 family)
MLNVLLIQPPYVQVPGRFNQSPPVPPLGIAYLAAYIRREMAGRAQVRIIDAFSLGWDQQRVLLEIREQAPDVVGWTTVTLTANFVKHTAPLVRKHLPEALQIAGGPHASALPGDLLPEVDATVQGEGELTLHELLERKTAGRDWRDVQGISFMDGAQVIENPRRALIQNLDSLPFPARDLLPMHLYEHHYPYKTRNRNFATFFTSRGCPFKCAFCTQHVVWGGVERDRSMDNTFEEIEHLIRDHDISFIFFYDDTFTLKRKRVEEFCNRLIEEKLPLKWSCLTRADCLDEDIILLMKRSGCVEFQIGIESGSDVVLDSIKKKVRLDTLKETFNIIHKHGLRTKGFFILGHLADTKHTMRETVNTAIALDPSWVFFSTLIPLPGSELYETAKQKGYLETADWDQFNYHNFPIIHTENFTAAELDRIRRLAYREFYLRPRKLAAYAADVITSGGYRRMFNNFLAFMDLSSSSH